MRAAVPHAFGPPEHLTIEDRPDLRPGPGEVVVFDGVGGAIGLHAAAAGHLKPVVGRRFTLDDVAAAHAAIEARATGGKTLLVA